MGRTTPSNYVPLDINFARDSAVRAAGPMAELLYVRGLAYAKGSKSDGYVPAFDLPVVAVGIPGARRLAAALVAGELWIPVEGGWLIRSWLRWNTSDNLSSESGRKGNHKRWHTSLNVVSLDCQFCQPDIAPRSPPDSQPDTKRESGGESQGNLSTPKGGRKPPAADPPNAGILVGRWVDLHQQRPPSSVVGQVARHAGSLLDEGFSAGQVWSGLELLRQKGLHPATLPSLVNEAANAPVVDQSVPEAWR